MQQYNVTIPLTEGYSVVVFIQTPNSGAGINAHSIDPKLLKDEKWTKALGDLLGEVATTSIKTLEKTPRDMETYTAEHRYARFYHIGEHAELVKGNGFVQFELEDVE